MTKPIFIVLIATILTVSYADTNCSVRKIYWEQMADTLKRSTIESDEINKDALEYYNGNFNICDNHRSLKLINILSNHQINHLSVHNA